MKSPLAVPLLLLLGPHLAGAQENPTSVLPADLQIAAAVAPLPEAFREEAAVLGYSPDAPGLVILREGTGSFVCLADDPADQRFHVACYHRSLDPFMARGRQLRAQGFSGEVLDSIRNTEAEAGTLLMPRHPATLYSLTGPPESHDPATGAIAGARALYVIYVPFATGESTGLPTRPEGRLPWLMNAGTPKAHIMFMPEM
jgi:hypothetical protein